MTTRHLPTAGARALTAFGLAVALALPTQLPATAAAAAPSTITFHSDGNPILADGTFYSADPAPLVVDDELYIYAGHDEAAPQQAGFEMHDYGIFSTSDVAAGNWTLHQDAMDPDEVFAWANGNNAYAGQTVEGQDGRFYWFAPVQATDTTLPNQMSIGVAVSDTPVGPWTDAIGEPLLDWRDVFGDSTVGNEVIDPAIFTDDDGTNYLYWGSWSVARVVELTSSLTATTGAIQVLSGLDGFYEAPWVVKRNNLYYMVYDWKVGGSSCTPSNYQACIGYATASSPLGPWTYQGIILGGTSATTVHPSLIEYRNQWYITYHTKDAVGGGHFRRSVAIDEVEWDGDRILPVRQTWAQDPEFALTENVARDAVPSASFTEQPPMRLGALNDGRALTALLPPDQWGNYRGTTSSHESDWTSYRWDAPVRIDGSGIQFHRDGNWIRPPASWKLEYLDAAGDWTPVTGASYPTAVDTWNQVSFDPVTTTALRATYSGAPEGAYYHSVSVSEWEVYGVDPSGYTPVEVITEPGVAPVLPEAVRSTYDGADQVWAPVNWMPVDAADYATEGSFTVTGRAVGHPDALVRATVVVDADATAPVVPDSAAPAVSISFAGTQGKDGWFSSAVTARVAADDAVDYRTAIATRNGSAAFTTTQDVRHVDVPLTAEGSNQVTGRATDARANTSPDVVRTVKIDTVAPTASATVDPDSRTTTLSAADARSGIDAVRYRFDGTGAWQDWTGTAIAAPDGLPHELVYRATDLAGNTTTKTVQVPKDDDAVLTGNVAPFAAATASFSSGWAPAVGINDGTAGPLENAAGKLGNGWGTWPQVGEQWAQLTWDFDVTLGQAALWWNSDAADAANAGLIPPRTWQLQYLDGTTWKDVVPVGGSTYGRTRGAFNAVSFTPVTTRALRMLGQSWGGNQGGGSIGVSEFQAIATDAAGADTTAPTLAVTGSPAAPNGENDWYTSAVDLTAVATDDTDDAPVVEASVDGAPWAVVGGAIRVSGDGDHVVELRATDEAGNVSAVARWTGRIDATAPVSQALWNADARTVTLRAADDLTSVTSLQYSLDAGGWTTYTAPVSVGATAGRLEYRATDEAGNGETANVLEFPRAGVELIASTTLAAGSSSTVSAGSSVRVNVTVAGVGASAPTGTVRILDGSTEIGAGELRNGRVSVATDRFTDVGNHRLTVRYPGDDAFAGSSDTVAVRVIAAGTAVAVTAPSTATYGTSPTVRLAVSTRSGLPLAGQVALRVGGRKIGTSRLTGGTATFRVPVIGTGRHTLVATYTGDAAHAASTATRPITIVKARSTTRASISPATVRTSSRAVVTVRVASAAATPTGQVRVTVRQGSRAVVARVGTLAAGSVAVSLPPLARGTYTVVSSYPGTTDLAASSTTTALRVVA